MKITWPRILIFLFWAAMTGWLIRHEAYPQWFTGRFGGYRVLFEDQPVIFDSWMQITFNDAAIGFTHTWLRSDIESRIESHTIQNRTVVNLKLLGTIRPIGVDTSATLDDRYRMQTFSTVLSSQPYRTRIEGRRTAGEQFEVTMETPTGKHTALVSIPDDVMIHSPATEMAVQSLKPGDSIRMRVLDPISATVAEAVVQAIRREELDHPDGRFSTTVLKISYLGLEMFSWIDNDGRVLRHETPFGWIMTARPAEKIHATLQAGDIIQEMSVPVGGIALDPDSSRKIKLRLTGVPLDPQSVSSPRQTVEQSDNFLEMTVLAQPTPVAPLLLGASAPDAYLKYLKPSPSVQSDHPDILKRAQAIVDGSRDKFEAAQAISEWIQRNVRMEPTVSLPSALDVLYEKVGDCNEITYLFVALARAAGIPARIHVGLVYAVMHGRGAFYYHAWPSVYVGEWVEMDPTWGLTTVGATHISLVTGELSEQMRLLPLIGSARAEIIYQE